MIDRKEVFAMLEAFAPETNQTAKDKGFWDAGENRDKAEMCMLMVSELGEALEAHRKDRHFPRGYSNDVTMYNIAAISLDDADDEKFPKIFENSCKDTIGDEVADYIIRLLDYMVGWKQTLYLAEFRKESTKNFAHDLFKLTNWTVEAYHGQVEKNESKYWGAKSWGYCLTATIALCDWWNIDIISHLRWKMRYNKTREVLHGKKY